MKSINRVTLLGSVGQNPEIRFSEKGHCIASFSLATSEKRKDQEEVTQWHNCVAFGKLGEIVKQYIVKGAKLYVDGALEYQLVAKEGFTIKYPKIVVNELSMLSQGAPKKAHDNEAAFRQALYEPEADSIPF